MMIRRSALAGAVLLWSGATVFAADAILGVWQTPDGATIKVVECATGICGDIIALTDRDGQRGEDIRDVNHPRPDKRDRKLVGTRIMRKVAKTGRNKWSGRVYHPKHGIRMNPTLRLMGSGDLKLTACLKKAPSICQDEVWTRVE